MSIMNKKKPITGIAVDSTERAPVFYRATRRKSGFLPRAGDLMVRRYLDDLSRLQVLNADTDIEAAKQINELEIELWRAAFPNPQKAELASEILLALIEQKRECLNDPDHARAALGLVCAEDERPVPQGHETLSFGERVDRVAGQLVRSDVDLQLIAPFKRELMRAQRNPKRADQGGFDAYTSDIEQAASKVAAAKRRFIEAHLSLVVAIAQSFYNGQMALLDLIQEGNLGLIKAVDRYDYTKGFRFITYATWWIRAAIGRAITDKGRMVRVPSNTCHSRLRIDKTAQAIMTRQGRKPTRDELQRETGLSEGSITRIRENGSVVVYSLDQTVPGKDDCTYLDLLEDETFRNPSEAATISTWADQIPALLEKLTPLERDIIRSRYGFEDGQEKTLKQVGDCANLSRERIRQLQNQALTKIKKQIAISAA